MVGKTGEWSTWEWWVMEQRLGVSGPHGLQSREGRHLASPTWACPFQHGMVGTSLGQSRSRPGAESSPLPGVLRDLGDVGIA